MIERKKKIKIIQVTLLLVGMLTIFFTYIKRENISDEKIISSEAQKKIKRQMESQSEEDIFYNIEYTNIDLAGNRYILKAKEATTDKFNQDIINMKSTTAIFYFKDGTILNIASSTGVYNNQTLDMLFEGNVFKTSNFSVPIPILLPTETPDGILATYMSVTIPVVAEFGISW